MEKAISAVSLPIHWNEGTSISFPALAAMLTNSIGTNTRNPHAAAKPMPRATLSSSFIVRSLSHIFREKTNPEYLYNQPLFVIHGGDAKSCRFRCQFAFLQ